MAKNGVKILSKDDLDFLKRKYNIDVGKDFLTIKTNNFNRMTYHKFTDRIIFIAQDRRLFVSPEAIKIWIDNFKDKYSLFEVQNSINLAYSLCQDVNLDVITKILKRGTEKILQL